MKRAVAVEAFLFMPQMEGMAVASMAGVPPLSAVISQDAEPSAPGKRRPQSARTAGRIVTAGEGQPWQGLEVLPEPYDLALLLFEDGRVRRGCWSGKFWWGYDERLHRSCQLRPVAWKRLV